MTDSYEPPAGHRPWQAHHADWAAPSQSQDHSAHPGQPAVPPARHPGPVGYGPGQDSGLGRDLNLGQDPAPPPEPPGSAAFGLADWTAQDPYPGHSPRHSDPHGLNPPGWAAQDHYPGHSNGYAPAGGHLERRPANWPAYDPPQPVVGPCASHVTEPR